MTTRIIAAIAGTAWFAIAPENASRRAAECPAVLSQGNIFACIRAGATSCYAFQPCARIFHCGKNFADA